MLHSSMSSIHLSLEPIRRKILILYIWKKWQNSGKAFLTFITETDWISHFWTETGIELNSVKKAYVYFYRKRSVKKTNKKKLKTHKAIYNMSFCSIAQELGGFASAQIYLYTLSPLLPFLPGEDGKQWANELEMTMTYLACISSAQP